MQYVEINLLSTLFINIGTQQTKIQFQVPIINYPWTSAFEDSTSPEYQDFADRCVAAVSHYR